MNDSQYAVLIDLAKLAEQTERYEDMADYMKKAIEKEHGEPQLTSEDRNLLSVAYKNVIGAKRFSWRAISGIEEKETDDRKRELEKGYIKKIEDELKQTCDEVLSLLKGFLDRESSDSEGRVFFLKMKGDYLRYLAEIPSIREDKEEDVIGRAEEAYKSAYKLSEVLKATHPIRLGLALNYSVFHYEIKNDPGEACNVAKEAFDKSHVDLDTLEEEGRKDSQLIMQLLRDNLTLWRSSKDEYEDDDGDNK